MVEKVKAWCEYEIDNVINRGYDAQGAITRCYGVIMFVSNSVLGYDSPEGKELATWWDDEMLPKMRKAQEYVREMEHAPRYVNTSGVGAT